MLYQSGSGKFSTPLTAQQTDQTNNKATCRCLINGLASCMTCFFFYPWEMPSDNVELNHMVAQRHVKIHIVNGISYKACLPLYSAVCLTMYAQRVVLGHQQAQWLSAIDLIVKIIRGTFVFIKDYAIMYTRYDNKTALFLSICLICSDISWHIAITSIAISPWNL